MEMKDLQNRKIKLSANSITCKDDNGKTCGIVRNVTQWANMQFNQQVEHGKIFRNIRGCVDMGGIVLVGNKLYYLFNQKWIDDIEKYFLNQEGYEHTTEKYYMLIEGKKKAAENGINVIECYFV